ncbi:hypothetical protein CJ030_MR1G005399 [Morella rubra]|uniref:Uncharacterized protein n=1 Tax=Morella rubra TaxID=262757 RepID=A0A6A1WIG7_9ROSI|nr:hypothetical protein CJ030_MR1G005399 [Morella rubra]
MLVRELIPISVNKWADVPAEVKEYIMDRVLDHFDLTTPVMRTVVETMMTARRTHRNRMHAYFKKFPSKEAALLKPHPDTTEEQWKELCDLFTSEAFMERHHSVTLIPEYGVPVRNQNTSSIGTTTFTHGLRSFLTQVSTVSKLRFLQLEVATQPFRHHCRHSQPPVPQQTRTVSSRPLAEDYHRQVIRKLAESTHSAEPEPRPVFRPKKDNHRIKKTLRFEPEA